MTQVNQADHETIVAQIPQITQTTPKASSGRKASLPIRKRAEVPPVMVLTDRERRVMVDLYKYRFLTTEQIEVLEFFSPTRSLTKKCKGRLQKLFHNGFVHRVPVAVYPGEGSRAIVYSLSEQGAEEVARTLRIEAPKIIWLHKDGRAKDALHLDHDLAVNNFWVVVERLAQDGHFQFIQGINLYTLKSTEMKQKVPYVKRGATIKRKEPDGYMALQFVDKPKPFHFFCEQDQDTKGKPYWVEKIKAYLHFRDSGLSEKYYNTKFFRVLTKTTDAKRVQELMKWTKEAGGDEYFWFTSEKQFNIFKPSTFLDPIWQVIGKPDLYPLNIANL